MANVHIDINGEVAKVYSPYSPERVEIIKNLPTRLWSKTEKCWAFPAAYVDRLAAALTAFGDTVTITGTRPTTSTNNTRTGGTTTALERENQRLRQEIIRLKNQLADATRANWAEELLRRCDKELGDKVYKALSRTVHPDVGGNTQLMQQLNAARDTTGGRR